MDIIFQNPNAAPKDFQISIVLLRHFLQISLQILAPFELEHSLWIGKQLFDIGKY